ncbi:hypothetical protein VNI00_014321 [Paramarasmius palmivorus]|uniref:Major facilitator superfamily (MFS) profile domain-containing protein n=1 Tax=Paramarasmius palmivorus TaxID=297713 RepID=A0AAW0BTC4_9AGAR
MVYWRRPPRSFEDPVKVGHYVQTAYNFGSRVADELLIMESQRSAQHAEPVSQPGQSPMADKDSVSTASKEISSGPAQLSKAPPDGGPKAWLTTFGGFLVALVTFGYTNAFGVYQDVYTRQGAASASAISWIGSTQLFFLLAMGLPGGKLLDMGRFRSTMLIGSLVYVFGLFMLSIAHPDSYYQVYLSQGLCVGLSSGILYVPAVAVQGHHWQRHRALAMGIVVTGSSIGGVIFPIMLNQLFEHGVDFGWAVRATAFVVLASLIIANLVMTDRRAVHDQSAAKPDLKKILGDAPYLLTIVG